MNRKIMLIAALPLALAACGGKDVVKETVVERPVVTKETIIERPAPAAVVGGTVAPSCTFASRSYSHGAMSCQEGREFRCNNGTWDRTEAYC